MSQRECPDCGATNTRVLGFSCDHERCPMFPAETVLIRATIENGLIKVGGVYFAPDEVGGIVSTNLTNEPASEKCMQTSDIPAPEPSPHKDNLRHDRDRVVAVLKAAATPDLLEAAEMLERAEDGRQDCEECEGEGEPEACGICFPSFDDARIKRRLAIEKAHGRPVPEPSPQTGLVREGGK